MSYDTPNIDNSETQQFSKEELKKLKETLQRDVMYRPVPHSATSGSSDRPVWRMRFELVADRSVAFGLDVNGEVLFGRDSDNKFSVDLTRYGASGQGVSRRHLKLRPTDTKLFVVDLGSTNGTWLNGVNVGILLLASAMVTRSRWAACNFW